MKYFQLITLFSTIIFVSKAGAAEERENLRIIIEALSMDSDEEADEVNNSDEHINYNISELYLTSSLHLGVCVLDALLLLKLDELSDNKESSPHKKTFGYVKISFICDLLFQMVILRNKNDFYSQTICIKSMQRVEVLYHFLSTINLTTIYYLLESMSLQEKNTNEPHTDDISSISFQNSLDSSLTYLTWSLFFRLSIQLSPLFFIFLGQLI